MIGYTFGAVAMLFVSIAILVIAASMGGTHHYEQREARKPARYAAVSIAIIFATAAVSMLVVGQAWMWDHA